MRALVYHGPGQKAWEEVAKPSIQKDTDAIVRVDDKVLTVNHKAASRHARHLFDGGCADGHGRTLAHAFLFVVGPKRRGIVMTGTNPVFYPQNQHGNDDRGTPGVSPAAATG